MLGPITGPSLGCVLKLGYRRPLDDTAFLGEIEWDEVSDPGAGEDCAVITGKKGKNKRKGRDFFGNNKGHFESFDQTNKISFLSMGTLQNGFRI